METTTMNIPVLALRGLTAFPDLTLSLEAEREISIFALDSAMQSERKVFLVTQREIGTADPEEEDLYEVGTVCRILQIVKISDKGAFQFCHGDPPFFFWGGAADDWQ